MEELTEQQHDDLAAYLSNQMTPAEKTAFEAQLSQNTALQQELELQQRIRRGMRLLSFEKEAAAMFARVRKEAEKEPEEVVEEETAVVFPIWKRPTFWLAAATILLLLGLFWTVYEKDIPGGNDPQIAQKDSTTTQSNPTDTTQSAPPTTMPTPPTDPGLLLADAYFSPTPKANPAPVELSEETDAGTTPDSVIIAQDSVAVGQGVRLLGQKQERKAIDVLEKTVLEGYPGHWRACAEWYLSLAYLRDRQSVKALAILTRIARTNGHPYQQEGGQLRKKLNK